MLLRYLEIEEPSHFSEKFQAQELEMGYNYSAKVMPVTMEIDVSPLSKGCLIEGSFKYEAVLPCARCLEAVKVSGHASFAVEVKPRSAIKVVDETESEAELGEIDEVYLDGDTYDTSELVKEQMYLLLPERVLCSDECKGICPNCGANRNETECKCPEQKDQRWSGLDKLSD